MWFIGILLVIGAIVCLFLMRTQRKTVALIAVTETSTAAQIDQVYQRLSEAGVADAMAERCEVAGVIECDEPLTSYETEKECVAYTYTKTREYEKSGERTNSEGKREQYTESKKETLIDDSHVVPFWVRDGSGRVLIYPDVEDLDLQKTVDRREPANDRYVRFGGIREVATHYTESILPVGARIFVNGVAYERDGQVVIGRGPKGNESMLVSRKTERELLESTSKSARNYMIGAIVCGILGVLAIVFGLG